MSRRHAYRAIPFLALLAAIACDGRQPLAPSFLTVGAPASLSATAIGFNQISLVWADNSRNENGFEIYRSSDGPNGTFALVANVGSLPTTYGDGGLSGLSQYCYEVRAYRVTGHKTTYSDFSSVACATTPAVPVPAAPSGVSASPNQGSTIHVVWTDNSTDEANFRIERAGSAGGPWTTIATFFPDATSLNDFAIVFEQLACYRVFANNGYGDSDPSNVACTVVPAAPSELIAHVAGAAVDLTWTNNSAAADGFDVERALAGGPASVIAHVGQDITSYHDADLSTDNIYSYSVRATRDGGTSGSSNSVQVIIATSAPEAPSFLGVYPLGSNAAGLYWNDGSNNEQGFRVERSTDGFTSWVTPGNTGINETSFSDYTVEASEQEVCYRVVAFNGIGDSPASNTACTTPPAAPTDLTATASPGDDYTVDLQWTDNSAIEDGYQIWVQDPYYGTYPIADVPAGTGVMSFQLIGYYAYEWFGVIAVKDGGYSDFAWAFGTAPSGVARVRGSPPKDFHPPRRTRLGRP